MKKLYSLIAALLIVVLTSMMLTEKNDSQQTTLPSIGKSQPMFLKGMITIKVTEGVGEFDVQKGLVSFNIPSLNAKVNKYEIDLLEKRFRYNPQKLRDDLPDLSRIYRIEFPESYPVTKVVREFSKDPNIEYAEPIPVNYLCEVPNDPMYDQLHHLPQIKADSAWDIHKGENGTEEVVIAIVDSGVDWDHEDLVDNIWQNMGEDFDGDGKTIEFTGGEWIFDPDDENGLDDDGNGFVDDFIGWNFYFDSNDPNPVPGTPNNGHGTHCAGLASATTNNNIGVASISWNLKILPIESGLDISVHSCYSAIIYAAENGADVISNSWAAHFYAQANHEAITYATGLGSIIIAAAGNNNHFSNYYPAAYPGVISVAAVSNNDHRAGFSNYGPNIWVSSPGVALLSTMLDDSYVNGTGTSMATPLAAGLLGLVKSYHPDWTSDQVITQVLGTADDIDTINPGFENQLGSGRINAYRALDDSGVTLQQEISIDLVHSTCNDADGNNMLEPGDTVNMSFKLRNYNYGVGTDNSTFTLTTEDPDITILNNSCSGTIPADDYFTLENVFQFKISEQTTTHIAQLELVTNADVEITWGDTIYFEVPVAPEGILVYQGEGSGNAFSGDYINEFLVEQGLQVFYTSHFPFSLNGFDAVFLSYGNYGHRLDDGVIVTLEMTEAITEYLMNGGYIYAECGTFFGGMAYIGYPNYEEVMELFGVAGSEFQLTYNFINMLSGLPGSICEGLEFTGSYQTPVWFIDEMTPNENGIAAFEEEGYGTVAVQGEGEYGQKTFCFSYALAKLMDSDEGTREELLTRIAEYFDLITTGENEITSGNSDFNFIIYPSPFSEYTNLSYSIPGKSFVNIEIYNINGGHISTPVSEFQQEGKHEVLIHGTELPGGVYFCRLQVGEDVLTKKIVKVE
ncbi:MAG: S8 family serine peptidase [Bacteroidales bacterium]|nr:S8 family serine peptidase [Bacteroidales bacterium]